MDTINSRGPIIERLLEAMGNKGVTGDSEKRSLIKEITGVSKQNLLHWFNGTTTTPGVEHLAKLSEYFDIDLNWLITGQSRDSSRGKSKDVDDRPLKNAVIDRLCQGMHQGGITDIKSSITQTAHDVLGVSYETITEWLHKRKEPTFEEIARLCEFYGVALRYVGIGKGPMLALDYIRAVDNKKVPGSHEVIQLQDVALLGNA